ncbi:permease [candidate division WOR-3 bacterium RBG_13_43_14]|uniref:Permease n=1 Tax=candidate division WOR-3 bacterium RBG_13_43_14 TaxID=1802590 RepID=A0A1F4UEZ7_UNCW3|nr:MAG: permease [candidate division WOR-3 bacterium RBG_13_43_14]
MKDRTKLLLFIIVFLVFYFAPLQGMNLQRAILEAFLMLQEYAREHVLFCLIPAFFIAGAISIFISKEAVIKYFGAKANKVLAYGIASVSGTILAVCSCTVLPMFAGIYTRGAGIGPATAFLYSGPAINILAIILTARILGPEMGIARAAGAISFSIIIGLLMSVFFKKKPDTDEELMAADTGSGPSRSLTQNGLYFLVLVFILIFAAWAKPKEAIGLWNAIYGIHWYLTGAMLIVLFIMLFSWFRKDEIKDWVFSTWTFTKQILPLLFAGVLIAGFLLGRPNTDAGIIPSRYVAMLVGGNSLFANFFASVAGAFMYFATLTEVPILQGLIGSGMGKGPALALLLAGPALSLPNMLVIRSIMGTKKMVTFVALVVLLSTIFGWIYGFLFA